MSGGGAMFEEEHAAHENHERYLLTYADMITLLMALFIILFAIGQTDIAKFKRFQTGLQKEFGAPALDGGTGVLDGSQVPVDPTQTIALNYASPGLIDPQQLSTGGNYSGTGPGNGTSKDDAPVQIDQVNAEQSAETVRKAIVQAGLSPDQVRVEVDTRGVVLVLATDGVTFSSGSWTLRDGAGSTLDLVTRVLEHVTNGVVIEGHTDSQPMGGGYTNWELSGFRAGAVVQALVARGVPASRFSIAGYADTKPVADNATAEGRAKNRRVEIVITTPPGQIRVPVDTAGGDVVAAAKAITTASPIPANPAAPAPVDVRAGTTPATTTVAAASSHASTAH